MRLWLPSGYNWGTINFYLWTCETKEIFCLKRSYLLLRQVQDNTYRHLSSKKGKIERKNDGPKQFQSIFKQTPLGIKAWGLFSMASDSVPLVLQLHPLSHPSFFMKVTMYFQQITYQSVSCMQNSEVLTSFFKTLSLSQSNLVVFLLM